jgi:4-amino-4-deoxy-L-arabinose transferase-like glycosyltransferase
MTSSSQHLSSIELSPAKKALLSFLFLVALALRVWPLDFPSDLHPDEENVVARSLRMGRDGLNPGDSYYPPVFLYILFFSYLVRYGVARILGHIDSPAHFAEQFFVDPLSFFVQARFVTALLGVGCVYAIYFLARRLSFSFRAAYVAATVLGVSPLFSLLSHFALTDVPSLLFFLFSLALSVMLLEKGVPVYALASGCLCGLALATKYPYGVSLVAALFAALFPEKGRRTRLRLVLLVLLGFFFAFFAVYPQPLLDTSTFQKNLFELLIQVPYTGGHVPAGFGYIPYLTQYPPEALGWPIYLIGILGFVLWFHSDRKKALLIALPGLVFWLIMGAARTHTLRYGIPMLPSFVLGAGFLVDRVCRGGNLRKAAGLIILLMSIALPGWATVSWNIRQSMADTRALATTWMEENIQAGTVILCEEYGPRLAYTPEKAKQIAEAARRVDPKAGSKFEYLSVHPPKDRPGFHRIDISLYLRYPTGPRPQFDTFWYDPGKVEAAGIKWIVLSEKVYARYEGKDEMFPEPNTFFRWVASSWREVVRFGPFEPVPEGLVARHLGRPGPVIRIFHQTGPG